MRKRVYSCLPSPKVNGTTQVARRTRILSCTTGFTPQHVSKDILLNQVGLFRTVQLRRKVSNTNVDLNVSERYSCGRNITVYAEHLFRYDRNLKHPAPSDEVSDWFLHKPI